MMRALLWSLAVGATVQTLAFALTLAYRGHGWLGAWGLGAVARLMALVGYAFLADRVLGLAPAPALLTLAVFFAVTTMIEPILLQRVSR